MAMGKKPGLGLLIGLGKSDEEGGDEPDSEDSEMSGSGMKHSAAKALIAAVKSGDAAGVAEAFSDMMEACDYGDDE